MRNKFLSETICTRKETNEVCRPLRTNNFTSSQTGWACWYQTILLLRHCTEQWSILHWKLETSSQVIQFYSNKQHHTTLATSALTLYYLSSWTFQCRCLHITNFLSSLQLSRISQKPVIKVKDSYQASQAYFTSRPVLFLVHF